MGSKEQAVAPTQESDVGYVNFRGERIKSQRTQVEVDKISADMDAEEARVAGKASSPSQPQDRETPEALAAREVSTLANPKKQKIRGRRSLASGAIGSGVTASREQLG